jgi:hypothetical protein
MNNQDDHGEKRMRTIIAILTITLAATSSSAGTPTRIEQVTLERTVCFETCPAYRVTISGDGSVKFEGKSYLKAGIRTKRIDAKALRELADEVERVHYFDLRNQYVSTEDGCPMSWTDNPSANTSVRTARGTKTIHHYLGCRERERADSVGRPYPPALTTFEDAIDRIAGTAEWIGTAPERSRNR